MSPMPRARGSRWVSGCFSELHGSLFVVDQTVVGINFEKKGNNALFVLAEGALVEDDEDKEEPAPVVTPKPSSSMPTQSAIDLTAEFLLPLLSPENVANLVRTVAKLLVHNTSGLNYI